MGLTDVECDCLDDAPEGANTSGTGYFLTDTEWGFPLLETLFNSADCGDGSVWDTLTKARAGAIQDLELDLLNALNSQYGRNLTPFEGEIGQRKGTKTRSLSKDFAGMLLKPQMMKGASLMVTAIYAGFDSNGTFDLTLSSNDPDFESETVEMTMEAGTFKKTTLETPWQLPFHCSASLQYGIRYALTYEVTGAKPLNNQFACCSFQPAWRAHLQAGGFDTDDVETLLDTNSNPTGGYANGLILEGYLTCDDLGWLCDLDKIDAYNVKNVLGRAIQMRGAARLCVHVLKSNRINAYTTMKTEELHGRRAKLNKRYGEYIEYLAEKLPRRSTDCFTCKSKPVNKVSL